MKELVAAATEERVTIPAEYTTISHEAHDHEHKNVWHEIHDNSLSKSSRTGSQICLVDQPAQYKTIERKVVVTPATVMKKEIPAKFETIMVKKIDQDAQVSRKLIPAEYKTVQRNEMISDGQMEWRSILCETNMTTARISDIQRALLDKGYNPGNIDGIVGPNTMSAVNQFQTDHNLPVDKYLNISTVNALNISTH